jgi:D-serine deaminase-like pyridoxal phosphate-dependent protein
LVIDTPRAAELPVGAVLYGVPWHVCPTVALYDKAVIVHGKRAMEVWPIAARGRALKGEKF